MRKPGYRATKKRRSELERFVLKHQDLIRNIIESTPDHRQLLAEPFVRLTVRTEIDYSKNTYWKDILSIVIKTFKRLKL